MRRPAPAAGGRRAVVPIAPAFAAAFAFASAAALACGACVEDKVAATYDHAVMTRALASGDLVVFCEVDGRFDSPRLAQAMRRVHGVRRESVRVSAEPAALSFAVDPKLQSAQAAVSAAQRTLPAGSRLTVVRLVPAEARQP